MPVNTAVGSPSPRVPGRHTHGGGDASQQPCDPPTQWSSYNVMRASRCLGDTSCVLPKSTGQQPVLSSNSACASSARSHLDHDIVRVHSLANRRVGHIRQRTPRDARGTTAAVARSSVPAAIVAAIADTACDSSNGDGFDSSGASNSSATIAATADTVCDSSVASLPSATTTPHRTRRVGEVPTPMPPVASSRSPTSTSAHRRRGTAAAGARRGRRKSYAKELPLELKQKVVAFCLNYGPKKREYLRVACSRFESLDPDNAHHRDKVRGWMKRPHHFAHQDDHGRWVPLPARSLTDRKTCAKRSLPPPPPPPLSRGGVAAGVASPVAAAGDGATSPVTGVHSPPMAPRRRCSPTTTISQPAHTSSAHIVSSPQCGTGAHAPATVPEYTREIPLVAQRESVEPRSVNAPTPRRALPTDFAETLGALSIDGSPRLTAGSHVSAPFVALNCRIMPVSESTRMATTPTICGIDLSSIRPPPTSPPCSTRVQSSHASPELSDDEYEVNTAALPSNRERGWHAHDNGPCGPTSGDSLDAHGRLHPCEVSSGDSDSSVATQSATLAHRDELSSRNSQNADRVVQERSRMLGRPSNRKRSRSRSPCENCGHTPSSSDGVRRLPSSSLSVASAAVPGVRQSMAREDREMLVTHFNARCDLNRDDFAVYASGCNAVGGEPTFSQHASRLHRGDVPREGCSPSGLGMGPPSPRENVAGTFARDATCRANGSFHGIPSTTVALLKAIEIVSSSNCDRRCSRKRRKKPGIMSTRKVTGCFASFVSYCVTVELCQLDSPRSLSRRRSSPSSSKSNSRASSSSSSSRTKSAHHKRRKSSPSQRNGKTSSSNDSSNSNAAPSCSGSGGSGSTSSSSSSSSSSRRSSSVRRKATSNGTSKTPPKRRFTGEVNATPPPPDDDVPAQSPSAAASSSAESCRKRPASYAAAVGSRSPASSVRKKLKVAHASDEETKASNCDGEEHCTSNGTDVAASNVAAVDLTNQHADVANDAEAEPSSSSSPAADDAEPASADGESSPTAMDTAPDGNDATGGDGESSSPNENDAGQPAEGRANDGSNALDDQGEGEGGAPSASAEHGTANAESESGGALVTSHCEPQWICMGMERDTRRYCAVAVYQEQFPSFQMGYRVTFATQGSYRVSIGPSYNTIYNSPETEPLGFLNPAEDKDVFDHFLECISNLRRCTGAKVLSFDDAHDPRMDARLQLLKSVEYARVIPSRPSTFAPRSPIEEAHNNMSCMAYPQPLEVHHADCAYFMEDPPLIFAGETKVNEPQDVALICDKCSALSEKLPRYLDAPGLPQVDAFLKVLGVEAVAEACLREIRQREQQLEKVSRKRRRSSEGEDAAEKTDASSSASPSDATSEASSKKDANDMTDDTSSDEGTKKEMSEREEEKEPSKTESESGGGGSDEPSAKKRAVDPSKESKMLSDLIHNERKPSPSPSAASSAAAAASSSSTSSSSVVKAQPPPPGAVPPPPPPRHGRAGPPADEDGLASLFESVPSSGVPPPPGVANNSLVEFMNETRQQMRTIMALLQQRSPSHTPVPVPTRAYYDRPPPRGGNSRRAPSAAASGGGGRGTVMMHQPHALIVRRVHAPNPPSRGASRPPNAASAPLGRPPVGRVPYRTVPLRYSARHPNAPVRHGAHAPVGPGPNAVRRSMPASTPTPNRSPTGGPMAAGNTDVCSMPPSPQRRPQQPPPDRSAASPLPSAAASAAAQGTHMARLAATVARAKASNTGIPGHSARGAAVRGGRGGAIAQRGGRGGGGGAMRGRAAPSGPAPGRQPAPKGPTPRQLAAPVRNQTRVRHVPPPKRGPGRPGVVPHLRAQPRSPARVMNLKVTPTKPARQALRPGATGGRVPPSPGSLHSRQAPPPPSLNAPPSQQPRPSASSSMSARSGAPPPPPQPRRVPATMSRGQPPPVGRPRPAVLNSRRAPVSSSTVPRGAPPPPAPARRHVASGGGAASLPPVRGTVVAVSRPPMRVRTAVPLVRGRGGGVGGAAGRARGGAAAAGPGGGRGGGAPPRPPPVPGAPAYPEFQRKRVEEEMRARQRQQHPPVPVGRTPPTPSRPVGRAPPPPAPDRKPAVGVGRGPGPGPGPVKTQRGGGVPGRPPVVHAHSSRGGGRGGPPRGRGARRVAPVIGRARAGTATVRGGAPRGPPPPRNPVAGKNTSQNNPARSIAPPTSLASAGSTPASRRHSLALSQSRTPSRSHSASQERAASGPPVAKTVDPETSDSDSDMEDGEIHGASGDDSHAREDSDYEPDGNTSASDAEGSASSSSASNSGSASRENSSVSRSASPRFEPPDLDSIRPPPPEEFSSPKTSKKKRASRNKDDSTLRDVASPRSHYRMGPPPLEEVDSDDESVTKTTKIARKSSSSRGRSKTTKRGRGRGRGRSRGGSNASRSRSRSSTSSTNSPRAGARRKTKAKKPRDRD